MVTRLCRRILRELSKSSPEIPAANNKTWIHIKDTLRLAPDSNPTTVIKDLQCYLYYLTSSRKHKELLTRYQGRGERSIEDSAKLVGLALPELPNTEEDSNTTASQHQL